MPLPRLLLLTLLTLMAFAANSVLCRLALFEERMDPALFTLLRLTSGALVLVLLCGARQKSPRQGDWGGALALITYGAAFSFSYLTLTAGTGALLLFAAVQLSMLAPPLLRGEPLPRRQWLGLLLAMAGLVVLLLPGLSAPDPLGAALMIVAGIAWAGYTLRASRFAAPVAANAGHFLRASLPAALLYLLLGQLQTSPAAIGYALASGRWPPALVMHSGIWCCPILAAPWPPASSCWCLCSPPWPGSSGWMSPGHCAWYCRPWASWGGSPWSLPDAPLQEKNHHEDARTAARLYPL